MIGLPFALQLGSVPAYAASLKDELSRLLTTHPQIKAAQKLVLAGEDREKEAFGEFLPRAEYPVRAGTHGNSAFALVLALDYARRARHRTLEHAIGNAVRRWFGADRRYPAEYEPSGDDFLSPGLCEALLMALRDVALSSGSACTSASLEPSHVLRAIGVSDALAHGSVRIGVGRFNTAEEIERVAERIAQEVARLRELASGPPSRSSAAPRGQETPTP